MVSASQGEPDASWIHTPRTALFHFAIARWANLFNKKSPDIDGSNRPGAVIRLLRWNEVNRAVEVHEGDKFARSCIDLAMHASARLNRIRSRTECRR